MIIKCVLGIEGHNGPDLMFVKINCSQEQYENGEHYETARQHTEKQSDNKVYWICDENDPCGPALIKLFEWGTASVVTSY